MLIFVWSCWGCFSLVWFCVYLVFCFMVILYIFYAFIRFWEKTGGGLHADACWRAFWEKCTGRLQNAKPPLHAFMLLRQKLGQYNSKHLTLNFENNKNKIFTFAKNTHKTYLEPWVCQGLCSLRVSAHIKNICFKLF